MTGGRIFTVWLPPLRERGDDVLLLADHFVHEIGGRMGKGEPALSRDACAVRLRHAWPGNISELSNAVERALIVSEGGRISASQLTVATARERTSDTVPRAVGRGLPSWTGSGRS